jgi:hypothetical protein
MKRIVYLALMIMFSGGIAQAGDDVWEGKWVCTYIDGKGGGFRDNTPLVITNFDGEYSVEAHLDCVAPDHKGILNSGKTVMKVTDRCGGTLMFKMQGASFTFMGNDGISPREYVCSRR